MPRFKPLFLVVGFLVFASEQAQAITDDTVQKLKAIRHVDFITVIDASTGDGSRGHCTPPLTPLQAAIAGNPVLANRVGDVRYVYTAVVQGARVYIYLGDLRCR